MYVCSRFLELSIRSYDPIIKQQEQTRGGSQVCSILDVRIIHPKKDAYVEWQIENKSSTADNLNYTPQKYFELLMYLSARLCSFTTHTHEPLSMRDLYAFDIKSFFQFFE